MRHSGILFVCSLFLALPLQANDLYVQPGLWEHRIDLSSESGRVEAAIDFARRQLSLLPPEQRRQLETMLRRQGMRLDLLEDTVRTCISEEEINSGRFAMAEEGGCELTNIRPDGANTHVSISCSQGQGEISVLNGERYTGNSRMTLDLGGRIERATARHEGRWVAASCAALDIDRTGN